MSARMNWFYLLIAALFGAMLFISAKYFRGSGHASVGITQAKEYKMTSEKPSMVKSIAVVAGQQVKEGDLLIDMTSAELEVDIEKLSNRIAMLKSEQATKAKLIDAKVAYVGADKGVPLAEIESEIAELESELQLNRKLARELGGNANADSAAWLDPKNPMRVKLESLRKQRDRQQQAIIIQQADIRQDGATDQQQLSNQITLLERELKILQYEKTKLTRYAATDGVVQSVYIKPGEQVNAFVPLLSITPVRPTTVVAYLGGKNNNAFMVGDSVHVTAYGNSSIAVEGKVIGYGSVAALPEILQKGTAVKAFGREVFIEIPPNNDFANGEKVLIR